MAIVNKLNSSVLGRKEKLSMEFINFLFFRIYYLNIVYKFSYKTWIVTRNRVLFKLFIFNKNHITNCTTNFVFQAWK